MNAKIALPILSALTLAVGLAVSPNAEARPGAPRGRAVGHDRGPAAAPSHRVRALEAELRAARQRARIAEREARLEQRARRQAESEADRLRFELRRSLRAPRRSAAHVHLRRLQSENQALRARLERAEAHVDRLRRRARAAGGLARVDAARGGRR